MKTKRIIAYILSSIVVIIGLYMVIYYAGKALPPTLSGIAFIIMGILELMSNN